MPAEILDFLPELEPQSAESAPSSLEQLKEKLVALGETNNKMQERIEESLAVCKKTAGCSVEKLVATIKESVDFDWPLVENAAAAPMVMESAVLNHPEFKATAAAVNTEINAKTKGILDKLRSLPGKAWNTITSVGGWFWEKFKNRSLPVKIMIVLALLTGTGYLGAKLLSWLNAGAMSHIAGAMESLGIPMNSAGELMGKAGEIFSGAHFKPA